MNFFHDCLEMNCVLFSGKEGKETASSLGVIYCQMMIEKYYRAIRCLGSTIQELFLSLETVKDVLKSSLAAIPERRFATATEGELVIFHYNTPQASTFCLHIFAK